MLVGAVLAVLYFKDFEKKVLLASGESFEKPKYFIFLHEYTAFVGSFR